MFKAKLSKKTRVLRAALVLLTGLIACGVPKFGMFINLIGSIACTTLGFIVPIKIYDKVYKG
jgi:amino acid permease